MYALDTNTLIYFFKAQGKVSQNLFAQSPSVILIPSVVLYEISTGIAKSQDSIRRRRQLAALLKLIKIIDFNQKAALEAGKTRALLESQGQMIGPTDILIAATALAHNAILITRNLAEFSRIPDLRVADWY